MAEHTCLGVAMVECLGWKRRAALARADPGQRHFQSLGDKQHSLARPIRHPSTPVYGIANPGNKELCHVPSCGKLLDVPTHAQSRNSTVELPPWHRARPRPRRSSRPCPEEADQHHQRSPSGASPSTRPFRRRAPSCCRGAIRMAALPRAIRRAARRCCPR